MVQVLKIKVKGKVDLTLFSCAERGFESCC